MPAPFFAKNQKKKPMSLAWRLGMIGGFIALATLAVFLITAKFFDADDGFPRYPTGTYEDIRQGMSVADVRQRLGVGSNLRYSDSGELTARYTDAKGQKLEVTFSPDEFDRSKMLVKSKEKWP